MKKLIAFIVFAGVSLLGVQAGQIPLKGDLGSAGPTKDPSSNVPVEVYQSSTGIELSFLSDLGDLCIEVSGESGMTVLQTGVKATAGSSLPIDTSSWEPGEYTLVITDKSEGRLEGYFEII
jgi:hypothetical protein